MNYHLLSMVYYVFQTTYLIIYNKGNNVRFILSFECPEKFKSISNVYNLLILKQLLCKTKQVSFAK